MNKTVKTKSKKRVISKISLAVVLGSGLGELISALPGIDIISEDYNGIHKKLIFTSEIAGKKVLFFSGRKHFYEGYGPEEITANMRIAAQMGVKNVLITNAAGGLNPSFAIGDMMLLKSHLNLNQKLIFKETHIPYSKELYEMIGSAVRSLSVSMYEGVYCCSSGPAYETMAEVRMLKKIGCDAVGMSTIPEVFEAKSLGMKVAAVSVITNLLNENDLAPTSHEYVLEAASRASRPLFGLIKYLLNELN